MRACVRACHTTRRVAPRGAAAPQSPVPVAAVEALLGVQRRLHGLLAAMARSVQSQGASPSRSAASASGSAGAMLVDGDEQGTAGARGEEASDLDLDLDLDGDGGRDVVGCIQLARPGAFSSSSSAAELQQQQDRCESLLQRVAVEELVARALALLQQIASLLSARTCSTGLAGKHSFPTAAAAAAAAASSTLTLSHEARERLLVPGTVGPLCTCFVAAAAATAPAPTAAVRAQPPPTSQLQMLATTTV